MDTQYPTKLLRAALHHVIPAAIEPPSKRPQKPHWTLSIRTLAREFKRVWLFNDNYAGPSSLDNIHGSLYFLFWKNLSVTNVSINELLSLVRSNTTYALESAGENPGPPSAPIQFSSTDDYTSFFGNIFNSLFESIHEQYDTETKILAAARITIDHMIDKYSGIFLNTVAFDYYYTSCLVHIPASLRLAFSRVVATSGYVHSAGLGLYTRNIEKVTHAELVLRINEFLDRAPEKKYFLVPYAEEMFGPWERDHSPDSLRNGLDGIRFYFRKHSINRVTLQTALAQLPLDTKGRVIVPKGLTYYGVERKQSVADGASKEATIWFVSDHGVHETDLHGYFGRGTKQYFIVYAQLWRNCSQLTLFKERKPAWVAPVTIPHTLSTALVNLAHGNWVRWYRRRPCEQDRRPVVVDAFCGTGTTLIDAYLRFPGSTIIGLDSEPLGPRLFADNVAFFTYGHTQIETLLTNYMEAKYANSLLDGLRKFVMMGRDVSTIPGEPPKNPRRALACVSSLIFGELFANAPGAESLEEITDPLVFSNAVQATIDGGFSERCRAVLEGFELDVRLLFFIVWRGLVYGRHAVNGPADLPLVVQSELNRCTQEMRAHLGVLGEFEGYRGMLGAKDSSPRILEPGQHMGSYSLASMITPASFGEMRPSAQGADLRELSTLIHRQSAPPGVHVCRVVDSALALAELAECVDIMITDPPYGFNTGDSAKRMRELYGTFIRAAIGTLTSYGQLIVALPDYARNGRQIPFYQTRAAVVQQVISHAEELGKRIIHFDETKPDRSGLFSPPYYWAAPTGVSRSVVHFTLIKA